MKKPVKRHSQIKVLTKVQRITNCWKCLDIETEEQMEENLAVFTIQATDQ